MTERAKRRSERRRCWYLSDSPTERTLRLLRSIRANRFIVKTQAGGFALPEWAIAIGNVAHSRRSKWELTRCRRAAMFLLQHGKQAQDAWLTAYEMSQGESRLGYLLGLAAHFKKGSKA